MLEDSPPPVAEEPVQEEPPFPAPGHEIDDPNYTPKENCRIRRDDEFNRCIDHLDKFPEVRRIDCEYNKDLNTLGCSCVEPVAQDKQVMCGNICNREHANCTLAASYGVSMCIEEHKDTINVCRARGRINLNACEALYLECMAPPPPIEELFAIVEDTPDYRPPS